MGGFYCFQSCELYSVCKTSTLLANLHVHLICHMGVFCCFRFILSISHHWRVGLRPSPPPANDDTLYEKAWIHFLLILIKTKTNFELKLAKSSILTHTLRLAQTKLRDPPQPHSVRVALKLNLDLFLLLLIKTKEKILNLEF